MRITELYTQRINETKTRIRYLNQRLRYCLKKGYTETADSYKTQIPKEEVRLQELIAYRENLYAVNRRR